MRARDRPRVWHLGDDLVEVSLERGVERPQLIGGRRVLLGLDLLLQELRLAAQVLHALRNVLQHGARVELIVRAGCGGWRDKLPRVRALRGAESIPWIVSMGEACVRRPGLVVRRPKPRRQLPRRDLPRGFSSHPQVGSLFPVVLGPLIRGRSVWLGVWLGRVVGRRRRGRRLLRRGGRR